MLSTRDYAKFLDTEFGLVDKYHISALETDPIIYTVIIDVGQRLGDKQFGIDDRVGAWDLTLAGALRRGIGEGVERYALRSSAGRDKPCIFTTEDQLLDMALRLPPARHKCEMLAGIRTRSFAVGKVTQDTVYVDADWVNLPTSDESRARYWFGTPSGTASHVSLEGALDSSIRELFERDAVTRAWNRLIPIERVEKFAGQCRSLRYLNKLLAAFPIRIYRIPTQANLPDTYMAWFIGEGYAAAGSSLELCPACAALHAAIETCQVGAVLREIHQGREVLEKDHENSCIGISKSANDFADLSASRMDFWASMQGIEAWQRWDSTASQIKLECEHLDTVITPVQIAQQGFTHVYVDLTHRLPKAIRNSGFVVVKSVIPEIYALPMSEGQQWNFVKGGQPYSFWEPLL